MKQKNPIKFGTDGWRAVIAEDFTFDNVRICAQGLADYMKQTGLAEKGLVIGFDNRFASEDFAAAAAEVAAGNGIKVYLSPKGIPTPVVSFGVTVQKAGAGVVITASHNPARYNGFKIKSMDGASAPTSMIEAVEANINRIYPDPQIKQRSLAEGLNRGQIEQFNFDPLYLQRMAQFVDLSRIQQSGLSVVVDSMFGVGTGYFRQLLEGGSLALA